jgi:uncharacterized membrane protein (UPF0127 family)
VIAARPLAALLLAAALAAVACRSGGAAGPTERDAASPPPGAGPRVVIEGPSGRSSAVRVELARTPEEQARGLMFREKLADDEGMLFVFPASAVQSFWMKNTLIPLDMIFIGEDLTVVGLVERAEPHSLTPRSVRRPSRYVLEVNGGWSAARGVAAGDRVRFENLPASP